MFQIYHITNIEESPKLSFNRLTITISKKIMYRNSGTCLKVRLLRKEVSSLGAGTPMLRACKPESLRVKRQRSPLSY